MQLQLDALIAPADTTRNDTFAMLAADVSNALSWERLIVGNHLTGSQHGKMNVER